MDLSGLIKAHQRIHATWQFDKTASWPEGFAQRRYLSKMEPPDPHRSLLRREKAFATWSEFDGQLGLPSLLPGNWYRARETLHKWCGSFRLASAVFTNGSKLTPTRGKNSLESQLIRQPWDCTPDCFDLWVTVAWNTPAIRKTVRRRFKKAMRWNSRDIRRFHSETRDLYDGYRPVKVYRLTSAHCEEGKVSTISNPTGEVRWEKRACASRIDFRFYHFRRMLSKVTRVVHASRFSTVPKNREKDRPIDVQPFCNVLVQRCVGNGFRQMLKDVVGVDLDSLASKHRQLIQNRGLATIDLKNASDSVQLELCEFLFPRRVYDFLVRSRTPYTEGLNGDFIVTKKVSSMGNGFTFELMSAILLALGREHSDEFSVFGDDCIIPNESAKGFIKDLEAVGFVVNDEKSFIDSPFRESCGANWHDDFGYVESYDFRFPTTIHDCLVLANKAYALGRSYPTFRSLWAALNRCVPTTLQGPSGEVIFDDQTHSALGCGKDNTSLSTFFWAEKPKGSLSGRNEQRVRSALECLHLNTDENGNLQKLRSFIGFVWRPARVSPTLIHLIPWRHTGKYWMYLQAGRRTDDVYTGRGSWQPVAYLQVGQRAFRVKSLEGLKGLRLLPPSV